MLCLRGFKLYSRWVPLFCLYFCQQIDKKLGVVY